MEAIQLKSFSKRCVINLYRRADYLVQAEGVSCCGDALHGKGGGAFEGVVAAECKCAEL